MSFIFIVVLRARKRLTPKDFAAVKGLIIGIRLQTILRCIIFPANKRCNFFTYLITYVKECHNNFYNTSELSRLGSGAMLILKCYLLYYAFYIHKNLHLESLYPLQKLHQNPLPSFKDLSLHRQTAGSDFVLYNVIIIIIIIMRRRCEEKYHVKSIWHVNKVQFTSMKFYAF
jgi:hypothetical protein